MNTNTKQKAGLSPGCLIALLLLLARLIYYLGELPSP